MQNSNPSYYFDLSSYQHASLFKEIRFVWEALKKIPGHLNALPLGLIQVDIPSGAFLINPETISIGKGTIIEPGAYIKGPCFIGDHCVIRHGAYIRGDFICGNHCVIGHDTEVKNAIFLDRVHAAHFAYVGDSILGNEVNLGAGTKLANLKFDQTFVQVLIDEQTISTEQRKLGAIIGDRSQTGCNVVTSPGTLIGKEVFCYPCLNIRGVIPSNSIVKSQTGLRIIVKNHSLENS
jgi:NDP-sugar pyrophosphorylase family protein